MTIDETSITDHLLDPEDRAHGQMVLGALRTTLPLALHEARLMQAFGVPEDQIRMALKIGHWLVGASLLLVIYFLIARLSGFDAFSPPVLLFSIAALFTFPMSNITIKTFNYDLVSSLGATISLLLILLAFSKRVENGLAVSLVALVVATLSAQEKLSGSPILVIALTASALMVARRRPARPNVAAVRGMVVAILISVSVSAIFTILYAVALPWDLWRSVWKGVTDGIASWVWVPMQIVSGRGGGELPNRFGAALIAIVCLVGMATAIGSASGRLSQAQRTLALRNILRVVAGCVLVALVTGVVSIAWLQPYWAPYHPSLRPPAFAMNGAWLHFGLDSPAMTKFAFVAYAFQVLVVAMPTPVFVLVLVANLLLIIGRRDYDPAAAFLFAIALILTLIGAVLQVPLAHRYLNIPLFLLLAGSLTVVMGRVQEYLVKRRTRLAAASVFAVTASLFLILETAPFRPLYAAFRPFWLEYADAKFVETGRINPSWMGWGEERALLGAKFEELCERSPNVCQDGRIFHFYSGRWLPERPRSFQIFDAASVAGKEPLGDHDYHLFNRSRIVQGLPQPKSRPILTLDYRGYEMAWLYRGSDLAAENYGFGR
ncbi:hypothetical protein CT676_09615 [Bradyrhizobium sp. MOS001]|uniref:hypothetical protein n=1 Tax=Bradyrhizobium sp. MOS001 TaxID=2133948 RepID=UPI001075822A|nr:hypothetical protein [Bradyrhizobium sp. MOS001]TFW61130.1 hypothetical protein CT676_09615 [Bradyrhizobium sp. MOS001]